MEATRPAIFVREWRRGGAPGSRGDPAWRLWGARTSGEDPVAQAM